MSKQLDEIGARRQLLADGRSSLARVGDPLARPAHRFTHEGTEVVVLSDGYFFLPTEVVAPDATAAERARLEAQLGATDGAIAIGVNVPVLRRGDELIVVDVGGGGRFRPTEGRLFANALAAGIDPLAVTRVALTHAHPDHIWGVTDADGRLKFPNATYYIAASEWDFWSRDDFASVMPEALRPFAEGAKRSFEAIRDRVVMLRPGGEVVPGLLALGTPGHTPGHLSFMLDGRDPLILAGDALTNELTSVEHPGWRFGNDTDADLAIRTRQRLLDYLASSGSRVLAAHFTYPGTRTVERSGTAFRLTPAV